MILAEPDEFEGHARFGRSLGEVFHRPGDPRRKFEAGRTRQFEMADHVFVRIPVAVRFETDAAGRDVEELLEAVVVRFGARLVVGRGAGGEPHDAHLQPLRGNAHEGALLDSLPEWIQFECKGLAGTREDGRPGHVACVVRHRRFHDPCLTAPDGVTAADEPMISGAHLIDGCDHREAAGGAVGGGDYEVSGLDHDPP